MKLYRGIAAEEFELLTGRDLLGCRKSWIEVLRRRERGDFRYPRELDAEIRELARMARLGRQHFTDDRKIAQRYAKATNGLVVELDVSPETLTQHFRLEFQNFSSRRKKFEIVYVVEAKTLSRHAKAWRLKAKKVGPTVR